jgi:RHH-type proline utilization regulon transcriptional repressor/proline dehydrogenase/delta 1-pyrroline-5-carboxylate dehydrogenase
MSINHNTAMDSQEIEKRVHDIGEDLWKRIRDHQPGLFNKSFWQGMLMDQAMGDPSFKIDLFRLVDVLPALTTNEEISRHIAEYLDRPDRPLPALFGLAVKATGGRIARGLAVKAFKGRVEELASQFIAGANAKEALRQIRKMHDIGLACTVDLLGEATLSDREADEYQFRYTELVREISEEVQTWERQEGIDTDHEGPIPRANISLKISSLAPHLTPIDPHGSVKRLLPRLLPVLREARERNVFVNFDLESWDLHEITYLLFEEVASLAEFSTYPHLGIVIQAYLESAEEDFERLLQLARSRSTPLTVRLVKGAYWDHEIIRSRQSGYPCPVFTCKESTDANFERLSKLLLQNSEYLRSAFASHNLRSVSHALAVAEALGVPQAAYEIQSLYGMAEPERRALRESGHRVRVYTPLGEALPGIGYLVRRLLENTANEGFLKITHHDKADIKTLLRAPSAKTSHEPGPSSRGNLTTTFRNCPLSDFTSKETREAFADAIEAWRHALPIEVPVAVAGGASESDRYETRECPSDIESVVAQVQYATMEDVNRAATAAQNSWPAWRSESVEHRANLLNRFADAIEEDRIRLAAFQCFEVGKPWDEADADVAEAIDFCRYYARQAIAELSPRPLDSLAGEENVLFYEGHGPTVVIAPWNFPMAILCGMTSAALVSGNTVIMKPSGQSSGCAHLLYEKMVLSGLPEGVVQCMPGSGREVGRALVEHPAMSVIAFTGSKQVGLQIYKAAGQTREGQTQLKRVICEMGGKNALIVDSDADLDDAVKAIVKSAFGYAGQKCSACSRVIVVGGLYATLVDRLVEATKSLVLAPAYHPECDLSAVIDRGAFDRLMGVIDRPGDGAEVLYVGNAPPGGYYVPPAIYRVDDVDHPLMQDELFGPIVAIHSVNTFEEALDAANSTEFALTGGVMSRLPSHLEAARQKFRVGNLYLNRGTTGALVGRQPFGGFAMSGGGTKAGGPGYLLHFVDPRVVTENTTRHGFAPEI